MQSDDFDKKIKEAAEHHHPAYEEKAWEQMEKLLDKHLPVKKEDRRRIIFLLLFLLLGRSRRLFGYKQTMAAEEKHSYRYCCCSCERKN